MDDQINPGPRLTIDVGDEIGRGVYANLGVMSFRDTEVVLDHIFLQPQENKAKVVARVVLSPLHAKRLLLALADNMAKYEVAFGTIHDPNPPKFGPAGGTMS